MATILNDYLGYRYDTAVPAFITVDANRTYHRVSRRMYDTASLLATMAAANYTPPATEIGVDVTWSADHLRLQAPVTPAPPAATTPATSTVAGTGTASATITIGGATGGGAKAGTLTVAGLLVGTKAITGLTPVTITAKATPAAIATAVAAMLNGKQDTAKSVTIAATAAAGVVTITEAGGGVIAAGLTAAVT